MLNASNLLGLPDLFLFVKNGEERLFHKAPVESHHLSNAVVQGTRFPVATPSVPKRTCCGRLRLLEERSDFQQRNLTWAFRNGITPAGSRLSRRQTGRGKLREKLRRQRPGNPSSRGDRC